MFEVYTYFGRVLARFEIGPNDTYHSACDKARAYLAEREKQGVVCWMRYKTRA